MSYRLIVIAVYLAFTLPLVASAQDVEMEECVVPEAYELHEQGFQTYWRILSPWTAQDTTDLRTAIDQQRRAYEIDPSCNSALYMIAVIHIALAEPDSAVAALELGLTEEPYWAELIGYTRTAQNRLGDAQAAFEYALDAAERELSDALLPPVEFWNSAHIAGWIRLLWLARGKEAALRAAAELSPEIAQLDLVRYSICLAQNVDPHSYAAHYGQYEDTAIYLGKDPPYAACTEILTE